MASRRAALVLPALLAILVGLLVAFWPRVRESLRPRPPSPPRVSAPEPAADPATLPFAAPADGPPAPAQTTGSLAVAVKLDGLPLKGARVSVQREGTAQIREFVTGDTGSREVQGMPPGGYSVSAQHAEYLPAFQRVDIAAGMRSEIRLDLRRGGRVFGRVTNTHGEPLPDTKVYLVDIDTKITLGDARAKTGADGRYSLPPIPPGEYGVRFRHEKHMLTDRYGVNVITGTEAYEINLALEAGAMIAGRVTDEQGLALADANVHAFTQGYGSIVVSDGDGRFAVHGLLEQNVVAVARRAGYGTVFVRNIRPNTTDLEIRMPRAGAIAGTIVADPLPGTFSVTVARYDEELRRVIRVENRMFDTVQTGAAFQVPDLTPTLYWVEVEAEGYEAVDQPQVAVLADQVATGLKIRLKRK